jgi:hypothetical protein
MLACVGVICDYITKSPKHLDDYPQEIHMTTQISTKFAALAVALMMNGLIIGGVAYLFNGPLHQHTTLVSVAHAAAATLNGAV